MWRIILKRTLIISVFLITLALTGLGVYSILRLVVSATLGSDIVASGVFYFAVVTLSLIICFCLIVFAMRTWGKLGNSMLTRYSKPFKP